jgi:hypothetical protein
MFQPPLGFHRMGSFYTSFVLKGASAEAVQKALAGRNAVIANDHGGFVVVFDEKCEDQNEELLDELAAYLSHQLQSTVMAFLNHDDSILMYMLYDQGIRKDSYNSNPSYFDDGPSQPSGGNAAALCEAFNCGDKDALQEILSATCGEDFVFESERHAELGRLLGHPEWLVGFGFTQIVNGEMSDELGEVELLWTNDAEPSAGSTPGYYKVVIQHPTPGEEPISMPVGWLPATWEKIRAEEAELSDRSRRAIVAVQKSIETLGFERLTFQKFVDTLNPNFVDGAGAFCVDGSREIFSHIIYLVYAGSSQEIESIVCTFRASFTNETLVCSNQKPSALVNPPNFTILLEDTPDPLVLFNRFLVEFRKRSGSPKRFTNLESITIQFDVDANAALEERIRKGQYILMAPFELWRAKNALPRRRF